MMRIVYPICCGLDVQTDYAKKPLFMRFMVTLKDILPQ